MSIYDGDTFALKATYAVPGFITDLAIEPSAGRRNNLVVSLTLDSYAYWNAQPGRLVVVDALSGIEVWRSPDLIGTVQRNSLTFADTDQNDTLDLILGTSNAMYITR